MKLGGMNIKTTGIAARGVGSATSAEATELHRLHILTAIDLFGPDRCMFESNAPVDTQAISCGNLWNSFKRITADFPRPDRIKLFSGTAASIYRIALNSENG
jgi:L-fuconolactonase